jgi:hypothetical protein
MWKIMVSRELSLGKLVRMYLACVLLFGTLFVVLAKILTVGMRYAILSGIIYAVGIAICTLVFVVDWDLAVPNFRARREARAGGEAAKCIMCGEPAVWVRSTQFSGDHHFCDPHARAEVDFGGEDPSYFGWEKLPDSSARKKLA